MSLDEFSDYRRDMAIEGQVRVSCDAKVFDRSYRYYVFTKERYGDVPGLTPIRKTWFF